MGILIHIMQIALDTYPYNFCPKWDEMLNKIINDCEVKELSNHTITFDTKHGQVCVQVSPRRIGVIYEANDKIVRKENKRRPRFATMQRLHRLHSRLLSAKLKDDYDAMMEKLSG